MALALMLAALLAVVVLVCGLGAIMEGGWHKFVKAFWEGWRDARNI